MGTQKNRLNEHSKHMLKLMGKKIFTILRSKLCFIKTHDLCREVCGMASFESEIKVQITSTQLESLTHVA